MTFTCFFALISSNNFSSNAFYPYFAGSATGLQNLMSLPING
jgi:hypothetical protein